MEKEYNITPYEPNEIILFEPQALDNEAKLQLLREVLESKPGSIAIQANREQISPIIDALTNVGLILTKEAVRSIEDFAYALTISKSGIGLIDIAYTIGKFIGPKVDIQEKLKELNEEMTYMIHKQQSPLYEDIQLREERDPYYIPKVTGKPSKKKTIRPSYTQSKIIK